LATRHWLIYHKPSGVSNSKIHSFALRRQRSQVRILSGAPVYDFVRYCCREAREQRLMPPVPARCSEAFDRSPGGRSCNGWCPFSAAYAALGRRVGNAAHTLFTLRVPRIVSRLHAPQTPVYVSPDRAKPDAASADGCARCLQIRRRKATSTRVAVGTWHCPMLWIADERSDMAISTRMTPSRNGGLLAVAGTILARSRPLTIETRRGLQQHVRIRI
jgi:hypothetical protein